MVVFICAALAGCACDAGLPELFHDRMEKVCESLPCGWQLAAGSAEFVETFHAGEHGLLLSDGALIWREMGDLKITAYDDGFLVSATMRCSVGTALTARAIIDHPHFEHHDITLSGTLTTSVESSLSQSRKFTMQAPTELADHIVLPYYINHLEFEVSGGGNCTIDDVRILSADGHRCDG